MIGPSEEDRSTKWPVLVAAAMLVVSVAGLAAAHTTISDVGYEIEFDGDAMTDQGPVELEMEADGDGDAGLQDEHLDRYRAENGVLKVEAQNEDGEEVLKLDLPVDDLRVDVDDSEFRLRAEDSAGDVSLNVSGVAELTEEDHDDGHFEEAEFDLTVEEVEHIGSDVTIESIDAPGELEIET